MTARDILTHSNLDLNYGHATYSLPFSHQNFLAAFTPHEPIP